nr:hypothetical protein [Angustibacter aerolatus]
MRPVPCSRTSGSAHPCARRRRRPRREQPDDGAGAHDPRHLGRVRLRPALAAAPRTAAAARGRAWRR